MTITGLLRKEFSEMLDYHLVMALGRAITKQQTPGKKPPENEIPPLPFIVHFEV